MKTLYNMIAPLSLIPLVQSQSFAQEAVPPVPITSTVISYNKEVPAESTYTITHNASKSAVPIEILEQINAHRRHDEVVIWKVNEELEILIYPFGVHKEEGHE